VILLSYIRAQRYYFNRQWAIGNWQKEPNHKTQEPNKTQTSKIPKLRFDIYYLRFAICHLEFVAGQATNVNPLCFYGFSCNIAGIFYKEGA
jgi:hypothetical protein